MIAAEFSDVCEASGRSALKTSAECSPSVIVHALNDLELDILEVEERQRVEELNLQIAELRHKLRRHEQRRSRLRRELLRRRFSSSPLGRLMASVVPQFLAAPDVLRWLSASPAAAAQLCISQLFSVDEDKPRTLLHHLCGLAQSLSPRAAQAVASSLHWPSLETLSMDMGNIAWSRLLQALWEQSQHTEHTGDPSVQLRGLRSLAVSFPAERSVSSLQQWQNYASPQLSRLGAFLEFSQLQELVLVDLRSTEVLTAALSGSCGKTLRVCRASFIGPESRRQPLTLPPGGLPSLECLMLRYRDFREQRASRQERMQVLAGPLLSCLKSLHQPMKLKVLALSGIRVDGSSAETAALLEGLQALGGLVTVALRFSVPATFCSLLPLSSLLKLRQCWPLVGHFVVVDQSLHGFDYWPCERMDFRQLYPEGSPDGRRVFNTEFRNVLQQYKLTPQEVWSRMDPRQRCFWEQVSRKLPTMPHSEMTFRVAHLFPSTYDERTHKLC